MSQLTVDGDFEGLHKWNDLVAFVNGQLDAGVVDLIQA